jgi:predicted site-specific integrase-resolvase
MENTHNKKQLSTKQTAKELNLNVQSVHYHYKKGHIKAHVLPNGKYLMFDAEEVARFKETFQFFRTKAKKGGKNV